MELRIISRTDREIKLEITGEDHTLGNLLVKEALVHPDVEYASYRMPHPLKNAIEFTLIVKEKASISKTLNDIITNIQRELEEFRRLVEAL
ncbi:MAG: DNA-directed RNA polymerase subunit L, partial [Desulfurococcaceae archaeon]